MATATCKAAKGFKAACPFCGASDDNTLNMDLNDLGRVVCGGCDEEFSVKAAVAKAAETLAAWEKIARFVELGRELAAE